MKILGICLWIISLVIVVSSVELEECSVTKRRKCRHAALEELDNQKRALTQHELEFHCKSLRENMECLVWQMSECDSPDLQEGNSDVIWRAWKYMKVVCDTFSGWWRNKCYVSEDTKKCERHLLLGETRNKRSTCNDYELFRDCMIDVAEKKCTDEESAFFGSYLLEKAGSMIWTCPKPKVGHDDTISSSSHSDGKTSSNGNSLEAQDSRLHAYRSAPLIGDSPFVTGCNARATEEMRGCLDRHQYERDQALGAKDAEDRLRRTCCASWNYRRCIQNAVRIHCYDTSEIDVQAANDVIPHDRDFLCREHWIYTCSGSESLRSIATTLALFLAMSTYTTYYI